MAAKTEEEKKAQQDIADEVQVVNLGRNSNSTKTENPYESVTEKQDELTSKMEQTISPFRNADGSTNQQSVNDFETNYKRPLAQAYGIDPNTGSFNGNVADLLGFDPEVKKREEAEKEKLARFKQKEAGWKNALGVITDIASSAAGGNVWKREADGVAAKSKTEAEKHQENIQKIGAAVPSVKQAREQAYQKAVQEQMQKYNKDFSTKVSTTNKSGGGSRTTHSGKTTTETTSGSYQQALGGKFGNKVSIGGKTYDSKIPVRMQNQDGSYVTFNANITDALSYARLAVARNAEWLREHYNEKDSVKYRDAYKRVESAMKNAGIVDPKSFDPNKQDVTTDDYIRYLQNGHFFTIGGAADELMKLYEQSTGEKMTHTAKRDGAMYNPDQKGQEKQTTTPGGL